jgi:hypothetical protein
MRWKTDGRANARSDSQIAPAGVLLDVPEAVGRQRQALHLERLLSVSIPCMENTDDVAHCLEQHSVNGMIGSDSGAMQAQRWMSLQTS